MDIKQSAVNRSIKGLPGIDPDNFPGVKIRLSKWATFVDSGWFDRRTKTIYLPENASLSFAQHEYGHYLQSQTFSRKQYRVIERTSFLNALKNRIGLGEKHDLLWTERDANRRAGDFFGPEAAINRKTGNHYHWPR